MTGDKLGNVLVNLGFITEERLINFLATQLKVPYLDLKTYPINVDVSKKFPERLARRYRMLLLEKKENSSLIGLVDPQDIFAIDEASRVLHTPISLALIKEKDCLATLDLIYRRTDEINKLASELTDQISISSIDIEQLSKDIGQEDIPVSKLLRSIFEDAVQVHASDIHIEPEEKLLRIRYRIDGVLQEHTVSETRVAPILAQRIKILAHLNIMERRLPQDGRFSLKIKNKNFDVRLSTMPIQYGESLVMRLLEQGVKIFSFDDLDVPDHYAQELKRILEIPSGMMLVTGPTGSGKTTTLFSLLNKLNSPEVKIITIEDPIEYQLPRLNQIQVNPHIDLTFANVLRSSLRQDPDIIMVGEIRDAETLSIALRAAMTGHLVLSTMHTHDTSSSVIRMLDLQSETTLIASALRLVLSQRLLRKLCPNCQIDYKPNIIQQKWLEKMSFSPDVIFGIGKGCPYCYGTGYRGRFAIFEMLVLDNEMISALQTHDLHAFNTLAKKACTPLWRSAIQAAIDRKTSLNEVVYLSTLQDK
ncbi:MAG: type II/IV secretion system protein [Gammaproteobacteria bacterium]|nr:type II/IV secretion system protein [Gammaproteobacteria bacterium]